MIWFTKGFRDSISLLDSVEDETSGADAKRLETNINLDFEGFADEDKQLSATFIITDPAIRKAVRHYTKESTINDELIRVNCDITRLPEDFQIEYERLISLRGTPLGEEHHTYSGTGTFNPMDITERGIFSTPAFISTSLSMKVAVKTTNYRRDDAAEDHVLHFILPEGFDGGFYVAPYSHDPEELEYLIFPQEAFRHVGSKVLSLGGVQRHIHSFRPK
jgi:hypothetical protein